MMMTPARIALRSQLSGGSFSCPTSHRTTVKIDQWLIHSKPSSRTGSASLSTGETGADRNPLCARSEPGVGAQSDTRARRTARRPAPPALPAACAPDRRKRTGPRQTAVPGRRHGLLPYLPDAGPSTPALGAAVWSRRSARQNAGTPAAISPPVNSPLPDTG